MELRPRAADHASVLVPCYLATRRPMKYTGRLSSRGGWQSRQRQAECATHGLSSTCRCAPVEDKISSERGSAERFTRNLNFSNLPTSRVTARPHVRCIRAEGGRLRASFPARHRCFLSAESRAASPPATPAYQGVVGSADVAASAVGPPWTAHATAD